MSGGKGGGTTTSIPNLSPEQNAYIKAQTDFFTKTIQPHYEDIVNKGTDLYNSQAPGVAQQAQNVVQNANRAQETLGGTGESALRTGISGLENLFGKDYEQNQIQAALMPAQAQYMQNLTNQNAGFGGAGELGSARQALANQQLAGMNMANQAQLAAQVQNNIAQQRATVGNQLAQLGQSGIGQSMSAAQQALAGAGANQDFFNKYATLLFGTPSTSYGQMGPYGTTTTSNQSHIGFSL